MSNPVATLVQAPQPPVRYRHESVLVTPELARAWLATMRTQRRYRKPTLAKLRRIIQRGKWRHMPHGVVFGDNGQLLDGQHRLHEIEGTGQPQWLEVTYGCPPDFYGIIGDVAAPKNSEDALRAAGCPLGSITYIGMAVRMLWRGSVGASPFSPANQPTNEEVMITFMARRELLEEAGTRAATVRELCPSPGTLTYVLTLGLETAPDGTRTFVEALRTGANLDEDHPALLLRNTWMQHRAKGIVRLPADLATEIAATLNAHLRGKGMRAWRGVEFGTGRMPPIGR